MRVLVDSNIVISAIGWDGNERKLLFTEHNIDVDFFICEETIEEFTSVLERKKFSHLDRKKVTCQCRLNFPQLWRLKFPHIYL